MPSSMIQRCVVVALAIVPIASVGAVESSIADDPGQAAQSLLRQYCYDCHGDGASEGDLTLDQFAGTSDAAKDPELWWKVLKNLRAGVMPPVGEDKPTHDELETIAGWIKFDLFGIDAENLDPGRLTVRRLNRAEYGNTINDLMGIRFNASLMFPADDSGHGFDNVGDALSFSPLLMEKYFKAARMVVAEAVPTQTKIVPLQVFQSRDFLDQQGHDGTDRFDGKLSQQWVRPFEVEEAGVFELDVTIGLDGSFDFDPARYVVDFVLDGETLFSNEYGWDDNKLIRFHYEKEWQVGSHELQFKITPLAVETTDADEGEDSTSVRFEIDEIRIEGPLGTTRLVHPQNYERFFTRDQPPVSPEARRDYAAEILQGFARRAFRSPVSDQTVAKLVEIAEAVYSQPGETFESGIARAMVAVLSSPRFLFHLEAADDAEREAEPAPTVEAGVVEAGELAGASYGPVSELALASRLSYFLWSTMPDDELIQLAEAGELRSQLSEQISRMMQDDRGKQFVENFVGQWLRTRDVTQVSVDPLAVLGLKEEFDALLEEYRRLRSVRGSDQERTPEEEQLRERFRKFRTIGDRYDEGLREAMRRETELCVDYIVREDRSLLELIDSDYTFLNESLARHYGIPDVEGKEMRLVELPEDSPRGGVLTQASMLLVTSNPTRTSPVKRGLFVLDNLLGTPAPPAPGGVPDLEDSADRFEGRTPSLRELLAVHREAAICASCHARMDPLGLALENFNALGEWRDLDSGNPIDASGELITGERFSDIRELKKILRERHSQEFYRCVTEKLLTYALGRGVEYGDEHTVDLIVNDLAESGGKFSVLVEGVIRSAPFQKQRYPE